MHNATSSTRVDVNFEPVDRDKYRWYAQYPNDYNGEEQTLGSYYGERDADERGIMGDLTSFKTGSVPPFLRGGTSDFKTQEEVFLSSDYDPVAVSRAIAKLNKESAIAQERTVGGPADQDRVAELQHKIDWLTKQRNFAEGSDDNTSTVSGEHFRAGAGLRGGAGEDEGDDDESRARHPECSTRTQDTATSDLPALEKEIMRLNVLMARAQKLPEGNPRNGDILAQLQRMIDQLEAERDAVQTQKAVKKTDHTLSKVDIGGAGPMLSGDAKEAQDAMSSHGPAPPLPLKSPARRGVKKQSPGCVPKSFEKSLDERTEFTELVEQLCKLDRSMACVEALVLAQTENPVLNIELASYGTLAMIRKLRGLLDLRVEVCNRAKLLASSAALSTTSNSTKAPKDFQYTSEVRLRGGGSAQSTVESEEVFSNPAAPPVPARNPARLDAGATPASPTDVDSETAILTQDLIRAGQQFIARLSQVTPSSYLARLEADTIERLVGRIQELQKLQAQPVTSDGSTSACRDLGTGVDAGQQAEISAIQRALSPILQAAGAWAPPDSSSNDAALESRPHSTQRSTPATTTPAPYRILNCPDWTWPHPNWMFNNLSPEQKISLLHERWGWLDRQRNIEEEKHAIDNEVLRLLSLIGLDHDPETHHDPITPGYDRLGNRILGPLGREEDRARLRKGT
ncbi:hypothetical protein N0V86_007791 [Didymella sp. IMI 355093]|nr:hypothetical protein N0V86_007791 [Didymella sp. IMI 355093]